MTEPEVDRIRTVCARLGAAADTIPPHQLAHVRTLLDHVEALVAQDEPPDPLDSVL